MSYQAIARKWRPNTFLEMAGQDHITRTLQNALRLGRIHHALLFTGARGVGKTTAARAMARALNCVKGPTPEPCGECGSCREILAGASPDVVEIDGASNNSVDNVRDLRDTIAYLPTRGKYRVYIIDEVHMLSQSAFNALLKTLEEPPAHVVFIFATTEPQKIPDTVLSRVQRFDFKRIPASVVAGRLRLICEAEGVKISDAGLRTIARAGEGSMRDAQSLLDQIIAFGGSEISDQQVADILGLVDREILYSMLEGLLQGDPGRCLDAIARVYDYGFELSQFTSELLEVLRNATLVALSPSAHKHIDAPAEEIERLKGMAGALRVDLLSQWFQALLEVHDQISRSAYPRLVLEMAVARLAQARPIRPVDELLGRLEDLERALRSASPPRSGGGGGSGGGSRPEPPRPSAPRSPEPPPQRSAPPRPEPPRQDPPRPEPPRASAAPEPPRAAAASPATPSAALVMPPTMAAAAPAPAAPPEPDLPEIPDWSSYDGGFTADPEGEQPPPPEFLYSWSEPSAPSSRPPTLTLQVDNEARYRELLSRLKEEGLRFDVLIENSVFAGQSGDTLKIAFPSGFILNRGKKLIEDSAVLDLARNLFPGVRRLEAIERAVGEGQTRKEARAARLERHRQSLWEEARKDAVITQLCSMFGAEIEDVVPLSLPEED